MLNLNGQQNINKPVNSLKNSLAHEVVLAYLDFSVPFKIPNWIHHYQKDKPLAFYSRKLTDP
jgi:hypothetical protein